MNRCAPASLFALLALAACASALDPDQARLCRLALPALADAQANITVVRQSLLPASGADSRPGVRIDYRTRIEGNAPHSDFAECRFGGAGEAAGRLALLAMRTRTGEMPERQLMTLKRFWLDTPDAQIEDPAPVSGIDTAPALPFAWAYALQQAVNALPLIAIYGLLAAAYSLLYGLIGRVNMAFGEFAAVGGYAALNAAVLASGLVPGLWVALACTVAIAAAALHGAAAARLIAPVLARAHGQQTLIATIGLSLFLQEYLRLSQGAEMRWAAPVLAQPVALARAEGFVVTVTPMALLAAGIAALAASFLLALLRYSRFGRSWRAYSDDPGTAALFGVNPAAILGQTFALACAIAGLAGAIITLYYGGLGYGGSTTLGLKALVAAILGGIGSVPGAFVGGVAVGLAEAMWSAVFPTFYRDVMIFSVLAALLLWRPGGLFGFGDLLPRRV